MSSSAMATLTGRAFEELAAEQREADGGTERAETDEQARGDHGHAHDVSDLGNVFHCESP